MESYGRQPSSVEDGTLNEWNIFSWVTPCRFLDELCFQKLAVQRRYQGTPISILTMQEQKAVSDHHSFLNAVSLKQWLTLETIPADTIASAHKNQQK